MLISEFDPWKSNLCTCPKKYSFSPYTGCSHACIYCYITSYIQNPFKSRLKRDLFKRLRKEVDKVDTYISMANSSDPYPPEEKFNKATRGCLRIFKDKGTKVLIITKSDLVTRDLDLLKEMKTSVSITVTSLVDEKAKKVERKAPLPSKRINAIKKLSREGIPCSVRLDPIIPGYNDMEIEKIVEEVAPYCEHIVTSTIKPRRDSIKRLREIFDIDSYRFQKIGGSFYLPREIRFSLLKRVEEACKEYGLSFATCREGYKFKAKSCDGSHLIKD